MHTTGDRWGIEGLNLTSGVVNMVALSRAELYSGGSSDGNNTAANRAAYIQVDQSLGERFKLAGGARYEHFSVNGTGAGKPVFRLGANYQVAEATFIRSSFGQGFRFPTIAERYIRTGLGALQIYPNEELRPEFSWSAEVASSKDLALKTRASGTSLVFLTWPCSDRITKTSLSSHLANGVRRRRSALHRKRIWTRLYECKYGGQQRHWGGDVHHRSLDDAKFKQISSQVTRTPTPSAPPQITTTIPDGLETTYLSTSQDTTGMLLKYRSPTCFV